MNEEAKNFYKKEILTGLLSLPKNWQTTFKRMYSHGNLSKSIEDTINDMPEDKLDWALTQVTNSIKKLAKAEE